MVKMKSFLPIKWNLTIGMKSADTADLNLTKEQIYLGSSLVLLFGSLGLGQIHLVDTPISRGF